LDGEREGVQNVTASGQLIQVAPVPDSASVELEQGLVDLGSLNPEGCLWREQDATQLDLTAFFLHIAHVLSYFLVQLVKLPGDLAPRPGRRVCMAYALNQLVLNNFLLQYPCVLHCNSRNLHVQAPGCWPHNLRGRVPNNVRSHEVDHKELVVANAVTRRHNRGITDRNVGGSPDTVYWSCTLEVRCPNGFACEIPYHFLYCQIIDVCEGSSQQLPIDVLIRIQAYNQMVPFIPPPLKLHHQVFPKPCPWAYQVLLLGSKESSVLLVGGTALWSCIEAWVVSAYHPCSAMLPLEGHN
jgi:hypothetical protein